MKKSARNALDRKRVHSHLHHWRAFGPSTDDKSLYVMCDNRDGQWCAGCEHIPCRCTRKYPIDMPLEIASIVDAR